MWKEKTDDGGGEGGETEGGKERPRRKWSKKARINMFVGKGCEVGGRVRARLRENTCLSIFFASKVSTC